MKNIFSGLLFLTLRRVSVLHCANTNIDFYIVTFTAFLLFLRCSLNFMTHWKCSRCVWKRSPAKIHSLLHFYSNIQDIVWHKNMTLFSLLLLLPCKCWSWWKEIILIYYNEFPVKKSLSLLIVKSHMKSLNKTASTFGFLMKCVKPQSKTSLKALICMM